MATLTLPKQVTPTMTLEAIRITDKVDSGPKLPLFFTFFEAGKLRKAQNILEQALEQDPTNPYLLDYLAALLMRRKRFLKSRNVIYKNYEYNPDSLFVKVRYADLLCQKKKLDEVKALFNNTFDLQKLYPEQKLFSINDYVHFMSLCGWYFYQKGEPDTALIYAYMVKKVTKKASSMDFLLRKLNKRSKGFLTRFAKVKIAK